MGSNCPAPGNSHPARGARVLSFVSQVGYDAGDGRHYFTVPGSRTDDIENISTTSNVGVDGRWLFRTDGYSHIDTTNCQSNKNGNLGWKFERMNHLLTEQ